MDIDEIWSNIITIKIKKDNSARFSLKEIEETASFLNMPSEQLAFDILKLNKRSFKDLKDGKQKNVKSKEYDNKKQEFILKHKDKIIEQIIREKIKKDFSAGFSFREIQEISKNVEININDLCINALGIRKDVFSRFKAGEFKKIYPKIYKIQKSEYLRKKTNDIFESILKEKVLTDFGNSFTYEEIEKYSEKFQINIRDFLGNILGIANYGKWNKAVLANTRFNSAKYKEFKNERMEKLGDKILDSLILERIKRTGKYAFEEKEIIELSKIFGINPRDFIVYVLGKTDGTYREIKSKKTTKCFSEKYRQKKEEILASKKEKFMEEINPNMRTYYSLEELNTLSKNLEISTYDLVVNLMNKSVGTYRTISATTVVYAVPI